jgi:hypothetical protein
MKPTLTIEARENYMPQVRKSLGAGSPAQRELELHSRTHITFAYNLLQHIPSSHGHDDGHIY